VVQTFFKRSCTIHRLRRGPLAGHIDLLAAKLATEGFSRVHSRIQLRLVGHFNRWLEQMHLTACGDFLRAFPHGASCQRIRDILNALS
jgi:hypothetical protein